MDFASVNVLPLCCFRSVNWISFTLFPIPDCCPNCHSRHQLCKSVEMYCCSIVDHHGNCVLSVVAVGYVVTTKHTRLCNNVAFILRHQLIPTETAPRSFRNVFNSSPGSALSHLLYTPVHLTFGLPLPAHLDSYTPLSKNNHGISKHS